MKKYILIISCCVLALQTNFCFSQEKINHDMIARIKEAGFHHSQVMNTLIYLTDVHGPRFSGTPDYRKSAEWAKQQMEEWGLDNLRLEKYETKVAGWTVESLSVEMIEPRFLSITSLPAAWTGSTNGDVQGVPELINFRDLKTLKQYKGKLKGKILLFPNMPSRNTMGPKVYSDEILKITNGQFNTSGPEGLGDRREYDLARIMAERASTFGKTEMDSIMEFLIEQEVAAVLEPSLMDNGVIGISEATFAKYKEDKAVPYIFISKEDHGRLIRMMEKNVKPVIKINQKTKFYNEPNNFVNVIGEIKGSDEKLKDQIVFIGAHLDSWHGGTGASDNASSAAVMMEVLRIFKQLDIKPRRTIKIGLWGGEEQMFEGSLGYVKTHVGDPFGNEKPKEEFSEISAYFNLDTGAGKIRGIFLSGNEALRPIFTECIKPFHSLGIQTITSRNSFGTDHNIFDALNIPVVEFIQNPSFNDSHQYHSSFDVTDLIVEDDLKSNAVFIATLVYQAAMRDEMFIRKLSN